MSKCQAFQDVRLLHVCCGQAVRCGLEVCLHEHMEGELEVWPATAAWASCHHHLMAAC